MKGTVRITAVISSSPAVKISAELRSGKLAQGMEALCHGGILCIEAIGDMSDAELQKRPTKGIELFLVCSNAGADIFLLVADEILEFTDRKHAQVKKGLILNPEIG